METTNEAGSPAVAEITVDELLTAVRDGRVSVEEATKKVGDLTVKGAAAVIAIATQSHTIKANQNPRPEWAKVPPDLVIPKGRQVFYMRFRSEWTDVPLKGHPMPDRPGLWRQCIVWALTDSEETLAIKRSDGDGNRFIREAAKQMIRAIDGYVADWGATAQEPGSVDWFYTEIGSRCRQQLQRLHTQLHVLNPMELADFFENCVEGRIGA